MLKRKLQIVLCLLTIFLWFITPFSVFSHDGHDHNDELPLGQSVDERQNRINEIKKEQERLTKLLEETRSKKTTLQNEIIYQDNQIKLTELKIEETEKEIEKLAGQINQLEGVLLDLSDVFAERVVESYILKRTGDSLVSLITSSSVNQFISRFEYLQRIQQNDRDLLIEMQTAQTSYEGQKVKVETLHDQLAGQRTSLARQKAQKQNLLVITQNDEKKYQDLLARARAEVAAIERVVSTLKLENGTAIKAGESIAVVGNTGSPDCSTGAHLHFEVRKNGMIEDPSAYIKSSTNFKYAYGPDLYGEYGTINPRGDWDWPLYETVRITQGYGSHNYAQRTYANGIHTGIDMTSEGSNIIKSPKDGTLYKGTTTCKSSSLKYVAVDHGGGIISWYWHVQ